MYFYVELANTKFYRLIFETSIDFNYDDHSLVARSVL